MKIFEFTNYKIFLSEWVKRAGGRGVLSRIAKHIGMHSSLLSQILKGPRNFSPEQAYSLARFLKFENYETEYLMALVQVERSGTEELRTFYLRQADKIRRDALAETEPVAEGQAVDEKYRAEFYSSWYYSGVRLLTSIDKYQTSESIAQYFNLPKDLIEQVLGFLVKSGLCVKNGDQYKIGARFTSLEPTSPFSSRHHMNWRLKALEKAPRRTAEEFFLTYPMAVGIKDAPKVKSILMNAVEEIEKIIDPSPCEKLTCLNIDWFDF